MVGGGKLKRTYDGIQLAGAECCRFLYYTVVTLNVEFVLYHIGVILIPPRDIMQ